VETPMQAYGEFFSIKKEDLVFHAIKNKGVFMICGSITMKGVLKTLNSITKVNLNCDLKSFEHKGQILTDCY
jgi:hypothetical protein